MEDHDQRFKLLLKAFLREFMELFFPHWVNRFDFRNVEWLNQQLYLDPPQGKKQYVDLLVRVPIIAGDSPRDNEPRSQILLIHIEIESRDSVEPFRRRMYEYYHFLTEKHNLDVLPIAVYMRVGLEGRGIDRYERWIWDRRVLNFEYDYVGLPALSGEEFLQSENMLGVAWSALMRFPRERRIEAAADALQRIAESSVDPARKYYLSECVQAYAPEDDRDRLKLEDFLEEPKREGAKQMVKTAYERGLEQGIEKGIEKGRKEEAIRMLTQFLEKRFQTTLSPTIKERMALWSAERVEQVVDQMFSAQALEELGLQDE